MAGKIICTQIEKKMTPPLTSSYSEIIDVVPFNNYVALNFSYEYFMPKIFYSHSSHVSSFFTV